MAHYYITDVFSTWNVADPAFPDELPEYGERIYLAVVDGPCGQKSTKALSQVFEGQFLGAEWLQNWYEELYRDPVFGPNATIIWVKIPPKPRLPEEWNICAPLVCENRACPGYDNGFCMNDDGDTCPHGKIHKEFSIVRPAKPATLDQMAAPAGQAHTGADTYDLSWRNATVYWVHWAKEQVGIQLGEDDYYLWSFHDIPYSATDDIQAIKMIMDRLVMKLYRLELHNAGFTSRAVLEYVSDLLANPYEWGTKI